MWNEGRRKKNYRSKNLDDDTDTLVKERKKKNKNRWQVQQMYEIRHVSLAKLELKKHLKVKREGKNKSTFQHQNVSFSSINFVDEKFYELVLT